MTDQSDAERAVEAMTLCAARDHSSTLPCLACWLEVGPSDSAPPLAAVIAERHRHRMIAERRWS